MIQNDKIKCKKAYTLVEVLVVISIMALISGYVLIKITSFINMTNEIDVKRCSNSIMMFINNSKFYCREKHMNGIIYFYPETSYADFNSQNKNVEHFTLPSYFIFVSVNSSLSQISINLNGMTSDACTITFRDRRRKLHEISIYVGTGFVEIKS